MVYNKVGPTAAALQQNRELVYEMDGKEVKELYATALQAAKTTASAKRISMETMGDLAER